MDPSRKNRSWIWFFVVVGLLAAIAVTVLIVYNLGQQLRPEQLEAAMQLWAEKGPKSYNLSYSIKRNHDPPETYHAEIRKSRVSSASRNGTPLEPRLWPYQDMRALFWDVQRFLEEDAKPGKPRAFARAVFSAQDGGLQYYVRSVSGTRERIEIKVTSLTPVDDEEPVGKSSQ